MDTSAKLEFWLRGPVPGIPPLLQPVAHALLQAREEVNVLMTGFPEERLWDRPGGVASPGFHLQHLAGVLDRLFTYAKGEALTPRQLDELSGEGKPAALTPIAPTPAASSPVDQRPTAETTLVHLLARFNHQIDKSLDQLAQTPELTLTAPRAVGRAQIPSTVGGLLFHAAEHTQRHTGQLLVTIRVLNAAT